jgi:hypothetical protein
MITSSRRQFFQTGTLAAASAVSVAPAQQTNSSGFRLLSEYRHHAGLQVEPRRTGGGYSKGSGGNQ